MSIKVLNAGLLSTIQDLGRTGHQRHGVVVSGAMDPFALRVANMLTGNKEEEAGIEVTLLGPTLKFEKDALIAICGGDLSPKINGKKVAMWRPIVIKAGSELRFGVSQIGCRTHIAVAGGIDISETLGSKSTYLRAGIGGLNGQALRENDILPIGQISEKTLAYMESFKGNADKGFVMADWSISNDAFPPYSNKPTVRVLEGPEAQWFSHDSVQKFYHERFTVLPNSDRMGFRLEGPTLELAKHKEMVSEPLSLGTIQVPSEGNPIVLLADRQTSGGYPRLGQITSVDIPVMAQAKPGDKILFKQVSMEDSQKLFIEMEKELKRIQRSIQLKWEV